MNDGTEALECARRCLAAIAECDDLETRESLWRAARKFHVRYVLERADRRLVASPLPRASGMAVEPHACLGD